VEPNINNRDCLQKWSILKFFIFTDWITHTHTHAYHEMEAVQKVNIQGSIIKINDWQKVTRQMFHSKCYFFSHSFVLLGLMLCLQIALTHHYVSCVCSSQSLQELYSGTNGCAATYLTIYKSVFTVCSQEQVFLCQ
jgi:hypothetical protein